MKINKRKMTETLGPFATITTTFEAGNMQKKAHDNTDILLTVRVTLNEN